MTEGIKIDLMGCVEKVFLKLNPDKSIYFSILSVTNNSISYHKIAYSRF